MDIAIDGLKIEAVKVVYGVLAFATAVDVAHKAPLLVGGGLHPALDACNDVDIFLLHHFVDVLDRLHLLRCWVGFFEKEIKNFVRGFRINWNKFPDHPIGGTWIAQQTSVWPQPPDSVVLHFGIVYAIGRICGFAR